MDRAIERTIAGMPPGAKLHRHGRRCRNLLKYVLRHDEQIILEAHQSYLASISPARIVATRKRLMIVTPSFWRLYTGHDILYSTHYVIIPYKHIVGVTMSRGLLHASIKIHTYGGQDPSSAITGENEVHGMRPEEAAAVAKFVDNVIAYEEEGEEAGSGLPGKGREAPAHEEHSYSFYHQDLGEGMPFSEAQELVLANRARFVWMGVEPVGDVCGLLGVPKSRIMQISGTSILRHAREQVAKLGPMILVSYDGITAAHTSRLMDKTFGLKPAVLQGGIIAVARKMEVSAEEFLK